MPARGTQDELKQLIELVSDPKKMQARLDELEAKGAEAQKREENARNVERDAAERVKQAEDAAIKLAEKAVRNVNEHNRLAQKLEADRKNSELALHRRKEELDARQDSLDVREQALVKQENDMVAMKADLDALAVAQNLAGDALANREAEVEAWAAKLTARENALKTREDNFRQVAAAL